MTRLDAAQSEIARHLFSLPEAADYALAGGAALLAYGTIDRPTRDIDAFTEARPGPDPGNVTQLAEALTAKLTANDWAVTTIRQHDTFTRLVATMHDEVVEIDLAVDSPRLFPTHTVNGVPMLAEQDLAARKILAILDRAEGRDFTDLEALQTKHGRSDCIDLAMQLDAGLTAEAVALSFAQLARLADAELPTATPQATRELYETWIAELRAG